jgi:hypothetical protein
MDEQVPSAVTAGLRLRGVDVLTVQEAVMVGATDQDQLAFAARQGRVLFTHDADFLHLHTAGTSHAGIAYAPQQMPVGQIVRGLMLIYQVLEPADMRNHVEFL